MTRVSFIRNWPISYLDLNHTIKKENVEMEIIFAYITLCEENQQVIRSFPSKRATNAHLWCFHKFVVSLNK